MGFVDIHEKAIGEKNELDVLEVLDAVKFNGTDNNLDMTMDLEMNETWEKVYDALRLWTDTMKRPPPRRYSQAIYWGNSTKRRSAKRTNWMSWKCWRRAQKSASSVFACDVY